LVFGEADGEGCILGGPSLTPTAKPKNNESLTGGQRELLYAVSPFVPCQAIKISFIIGDP